MTAVAASGIRGLNHVVLWVRDAAASAAWYSEHLGFEVKNEIGDGKLVFLRAPGSENDHDLGLFSVGAEAAGSAAGKNAVGMYHVAWEIPTLNELAAVRKGLSAAGALVGETDHGVSKSLYVHDPDGLEFEVMWEVPLDRLPDDVEGGTKPLDLDAEIAHYGGDTLGGRLTAA